MWGMGKNQNGVHVFLFGHCKSCFLAFSVLVLLGSNLSVITVSSDQHQYI